MSTEPQVARVVNQPEQTGSASQQALNSEARHSQEALPENDATMAASSAAQAGSDTPESNKRDSNVSAANLPDASIPDANVPGSNNLAPNANVVRESVASAKAAVPPPANSIAGRPAFPDKREVFQPPDRREPVRDLPAQPRPAPPKVESAPVAVDDPPAPASVEPVDAGGAAPPEPAPPEPALAEPAPLDPEPVDATPVDPAPVASALASPAEAAAVPREEPAAEAAGLVAETPPVSASQEPGAAMPGIPVESTASQEAAAAELEALNYDDLMADYDEPAIHAGDLCQGQIISIDGDNVIVAYGGKTEGVVPLAELQQAGLAEPAPGQSIEVSVESLGAPGDFAVLSFLKAHRSRLWEQVETAFRQKEELTAKVTERVKGGLTVDIGIQAFLPGSQADVRPVPDLDALVGQEIPVRIVKLSRTRGNVVVSRRALLEEELQQRRQQTLATLSEGALVTGTVKNVTNYGAFIDLGGIDGLLHVTDISWGRVRNPAEVLQVGAEITLKVLKFDAAKERVSLSLKHMQPDPWENIAHRYHEGARATGRVVSITDYGSFVELEPGLEGLIHVSELSWSKRLKHPSKVLRLDQQIEAVITQMNSAERRISLSLKRLQSDPWVNLTERYPIGLIVEGRVRNLTSYGAFVEIEEGVDGLVHVSDLSWSTKVKHPKDELKKGQVIRAVVLHIDEENRRVSLGIKQLEPDVWETFFSLHLVGDDVTGQITRFAKFGAFVELAPGVEGLCHNSEMSSSFSKQRKPALLAGQEYEFRIIKLDEFDKKISLSRRAYELEHGHASSNGTASAPPVESEGETVPSLHEDSA